MNIQFITSEILKYFPDKNLYKNRQIYLYLSYFILMIIQNINLTYWIIFKKNIEEKDKVTETGETPLTPEAQLTPLYANDENTPN